MASQQPLPAHSCKLQRPACPSALHSVLHACAGHLCQYCGLPTDLYPPCFTLQSLGPGPTGW